MSENTNQTAQLIAARLRDCREAKGWTLVEAACRRWARWEHGDRVPSPELAAPLAALFDTAPGYFAEPAE
ncbi:helix-turn-helix domain-containing protein [Pseudomonas aeruginosa]